MQRRYGHLYPKIVFILDFIALNLLITLGCFLINHVLLPGETKWVYLLLNISYLPSAFSLQDFHKRRVVYFEGIVFKALVHAGITGLFFLFLSGFLGFDKINMFWLIGFQLSFFLLLSTTWLIERALLKFFRTRGGNFKTVIIIGTAANAIALYKTLKSDPSMGYKVLGFFEDREFLYTQEFEDYTYLGELSDIETYIHANKVDEIYSTLPATRGEQIIQLINLSENNLIRYYFIPNYYNYLKRRITIDYLSNIPVLSIREEPLQDHWNLFAKRAFDLAFSSFVLVFIFPLLYLIIGSLIKIGSPGPIFFKQKRTGLNGKDFYCYKFRSMKMNDNSDSMQATENDPRKTKIGEFIRRTSLDEIPQFINVFKGEMSVVGPRPHMLKHTEIYSELVDKYMLRHFVKPGITGWAQVNGCRGETKTVEEMALRVKYDIFYIENWSLLLDIKIIFRTIFQVSGGDKQAY